MTVVTKHGKTYKKPKVKNRTHRGFFVVAGKQIIQGNKQKSIG
jgi:hypothetical protein